MEDTYSMFLAARSLARCLPVHLLAALSWDDLKDNGPVGSNLWSCTITTGSMVRSVRGAELSRAIYALRKAAASRWLFPNLAGDGCLSTRWFTAIYRSNPPASDVAIKFSLAFERHLSELLRHGVFVDPTAVALRVMDGIANGLNLDPEFLAVSNQREHRLLATFILEAASVPLAKPTPTNQTVEEIPEIQVGSVAPEVSQAPRYQEPRVSRPKNVTPAATPAVTPALPGPVAPRRARPAQPARSEPPVVRQGPGLIRFGRLRDSVDTFVPYLMAHSELSRAQSVALVEAISTAGDAEVVVTQAELAARETQIALRAEELVGAVPFAPFDHLELVWGHLRVHLAETQEADLPPWPQRVLPDAVRDDRDLALCLWAAFGPRVGHYAMVATLKRGAFHRPARGALRIAKQRQPLLTLRGEVALRAVDRILTWSGDPDSRVYRDRPFLPVRPGSEDPMPPGAIRKLVLANGYPLTETP